MQQMNKLVFQHQTYVSAWKSKHFQEILASFTHTKSAIMPVCQEKKHLNVRVFRNSPIT